MLFPHITAPLVYIPTHTHTHTHTYTHQRTSNGPQRPLQNSVLRRDETCRSAGKSLKTGVKHFHAERTSGGARCDGWRGERRRDWLTTMTFPNETYTHTHTHTCRTWDPSVCVQRCDFDVCRHDSSFTRSLPLAGVGEALLGALYGLTFISWILTLNRTRTTDPFGVMFFVQKCTNELVFSVECVPGSSLYQILTVLVPMTGTCSCCSSGSLPLLTMIQWSWWVETRDSMLTSCYYCRMLHCCGKNTIRATETLPCSLPHSRRSLNMKLVCDCVYMCVVWIFSFHLHISVFYLSCFAFCVVFYWGAFHHQLTLRSICIIG